MTDPAPEKLQRTALFDLHVEIGARMVPFAGYEMPVRFPGGIIAEHLHTRSRASLFDIGAGTVLLPLPAPKEQRSQKLSGRRTAG